jgi:hypothetical protein
VGARNSGKTNLAEALVLMPDDGKNKGIGVQSDVIILFGNGASFLQWEWLRKPHKVYPELKEEVIEECFTINATRLQKKQDPIRFVLVFDDSLSRETTFNNTINRVFIHGRIYNIMPVVLQQSISQIHLDWRRNTDIFFIFKPRTKTDKEWIHDNLLEFETKQESFAMLSKIPKYHCLVVDFSSGETKQYLYSAPLVNVK